MKIQATPDYLIFADEAKTGELLDFPNVARGWGLTIDQTQSKPPMEWMNGAFNRIDKNMLYMLQQGVPEWNESVLYPVNAIIKYKGVLYTAIVQNDNSIPSTSTAKWSKTVNIQSSSLTQKGIVQLSSDANSDDETKAATPKAVKTAYDLAAGAVKKTGDTMTGSLGIENDYANIYLENKAGKKWISRIFPDGGYGLYTNDTEETLQPKMFFDNSTLASFENIDTVLINGTPVLKKGDGGLYSRAPLLATGTDLLTDDVLFASQYYTLAGNYLNSPFENLVCAGSLEIIRRCYDAGAAATLRINHSDNLFYKTTAFKVNGAWKCNGWVEDITTSNVNNYLPVGIPQPWPTTTPPDGWLKCNGSAFDKTKYPKLAAAYPSGYLPDLRGEFIRGLDDGKGADSGRGIGTWQGDAIRNITGMVDMVLTYNTVSDDGALVFEWPRESNTPGHTGVQYQGLTKKIRLDASRVVPTANENRPRNVAFLYIVKAE